MSAWRELFSYGGDYTTQVDWRVLHPYHNDSDPENGGDGDGDEDSVVVGLLPVDHANYSDIVDSVAERVPDAEFQ